MSHGATPQQSSLPRIVFRADASLDIGTGHVMRCLALADELRRRGATCEFVCRELPGHRIEEIRLYGFEVRILPPPSSPQGWLGVPVALDSRETRAALDERTVDWLVADHYGLDARWEQELRAAARRIMVIDDLADRRHDCDVLLDQNLGRVPGDYDELVPEQCRQLCGPEFALLRPEFARLRPRSLARRAEGRLERILVTMGGVDKDNATGRVLEALGHCQLPGEVTVTVVMGGRAPWLERVRQQGETLGFAIEIAVDVHDMAERMAHSDFAVGAAGSTSWERCCMGLPSALVVIADNQEEACRALVASGAAFDLGSRDNIIGALPRLVHSIQESPDVLANMSRCAARITDGTGAGKVAELLRGY